jgi:dolichyl-phosphate-mannose--protein O-mannosyl transferase
VYLYLNGGIGAHSELWTFPNLVVFWGGLAGLIAAARRSWRLRAAAPAILLLGALVQYLPWVTVHRVVFLYHYLPVVPFLAIALAWWVVVGLRGHRYARLIVPGVAVAAVAFFLLGLPLLEGWRVGQSYLDGMRNVFPWILP